MATLSLLGLLLLLLLLLLLVSQLLLISNTTLRLLLLLFGFLTCVQLGEVKHLPVGIISASDLLDFDHTFLVDAGTSSVVHRMEACPATFEEHLVQNYVNFFLCIIDK